jgi:hypothetical protein
MCYSDTLFYFISTLFSPTLFSLHHGFTVFSHLTLFSKLLFLTKCIIFTPCCYHSHFNDMQLSRSDHFCQPFSQKFSSRNFNTTVDNLALLFQIRQSGEYVTPFLAFILQFVTAGYHVSDCMN